MWKLYIFHIISRENRKNTINIRGTSLFRTLLFRFSLPPFLSSTLFEIYQKSNKTRELKIPRCLTRSNIEIETFFRPLHLHCLPPQLSGNCTICIHCFSLTLLVHELYFYNKYHSKDLWYRRRRTVTGYCGLPNEGALLTSSLETLLKPKGGIFLNFWMGAFNNFKPATILDRQILIIKKFL